MEDTDPKYEDSAPVPVQPTPSGPPAPNSQEWTGSYGVAPHDSSEDLKLEDTKPIDDLKVEDTEPIEGHQTIGQQAGTIAENAVKGFLPGVGALAEDKLSDLGVPGLSPQEQEARAQANPKEAMWSKVGGNIGFQMALGSELRAGEGAAGLAGFLARRGADALNGFLNQGAIQAGDQVEKDLAGHGDSKAATAAAIVKTGAFGALGGSAGGALLEGVPWVGKPLAKFLYGVKTMPQSADNMVGSLLTGIGHSIERPNEGIIKLGDSSLNSLERRCTDPGMFEIGQAIHQNALPTALNSVAASAAGHALPEAHTMIGMAGKYAFDKAVPGTISSEITKRIQNYLGKFVPANIRDKVAAAFLNAARSGKTQGVDSIISGAAHIAKGSNLLDGGVKAVFNQAPNTFLELYNDEKKRDKLREQLKSFQEEQGGAQEGYADGGQVQPQQNQMHNLYPELGMNLSTAKGRVMGYLRSKMPDENKTRLPYDSNRKNPQDEHDFNRLLDLANQPMSILKKVKDGSLNHKYLGHFTAMYPELHQEMKNRIHAQIAENRINEEKKPPYALRQSLSLFLGDNLDSVLNQPNIAAAQAVFQAQQQQKSMANAKAAGLMKSVENSKTSLQGAEQRLNKN